MQAETTNSKTIAAAFVAEMDQEAEITMRLFNILPEDKMSWRPHPKAKSLGELAMHIATIPAGVASLGEPTVAEFDFPPEIEADDREQVIGAFEESLRKGKEIVAATDDARMNEVWTLTRDGKEVLAMPRVAFWRSILLNHNYHHRGQLSTYLRELDIPLPSIYGPSADTNPLS